jgi:hypothetical protein
MSKCLHASTTLNIRYIITIMVWPHKTGRQVCSAKIRRHFAVKKHNLHATSNCLKERRKLKMCTALLGSWKVLTLNVSAGKSFEIFTYNINPLIFEKWVKLPEMFYFCLLICLSMHLLVNLALAVQLRARCRNRVRSMMSVWTRNKYEEGLWWKNTMPSSWQKKVNKEMNI